MTGQCSARLKVAEEKLLLFCSCSQKPNKTFIFGIEITFKCHIRFTIAPSHTQELQIFGFEKKKTTYYEITRSVLFACKTDQTFIYRKMHYAM